MADEIPPAPSESDDASKAETIRITLPPKAEQQAVKRETVRINLPGKPLPPPGAAGAAGPAPKKETTKLTGVAQAAGAPPAASKPFVPPAPPKPPGAPMPPGAPAVPPPPSAPGVPPKPPGAGARPTVPLKPTPPAGAAPAAPVGAPKPAAPKKETARITLPAEGAAKPALPKATVKMQQTQPLVNRPAPAMTPAAPMNVAPAHAAHTGSADADGTVNLMSIAALVVSLISLALVFFAYNAASL